MTKIALSQEHDWFNISKLMNIIYHNSSLVEKYDYPNRFRNINEETLKEFFLQSETRRSFISTPFNTVLEDLLVE